MKGDGEKRSTRSLFVSFILLLLFPLFLTSLFGCSSAGEGGSDEETAEGTDEGTGEGSDEECFDCEGSEASFLHLDSEGIAALLTMDTDTLNSSSSLSTLNQETGDETDDEADDETDESTPSPVQGVDEETGEIRDALRCFTDETDENFDMDSDSGLSTDCWDQIPRIVTIAECDDYIYLVFERPFIVRTETPDGERIEDYSDPWSPSSPFTSQLLRSSAPITDYQAGDRLERSNLEGVLYSMEVNTWDRRRNIQFDDSCNLYLTARVSGTANDVMIMIEPGAGEDDYTEIINANICFENYLVTLLGDVHYTGRSGSGGDCTGDSFYRMVSSDGELTEITRDWWDYKFEPLSDGTVVFYGPNPTQGGVPSWDSACLFKFDGTKSGDDRYEKQVNCINDWWRYVENRPLPEFSTSENDTERERCAKQFYTYRGSNAPEKILSIDSNGDGTEEICVVSDTEYKKKGTWKCNICIDDNTGHCENSEGMLTGDKTQLACTGTTGNSWSTTGECYNDVTTSACTITQPAGWNLNHDWCQDPGSDWADTYSALSCIEADKSIELISSTSETVTNAWVVGDRIIYSSVEDGTYYLKGASFDSNGDVTVSELVSGIEMYEVAFDPTKNVDRILVNGLRFSDNSYVFGHYDFENSDFSLDTSLTGLVETMLILGN